MYSIVTTDPLIAPVSAEDLVDWARLDSDDPKINTSLLLATSAVISFLKLELLPRDYTLTYEDWPTVGMAKGLYLSRKPYGNQFRVDLPFANLVSIASVKINGDLVAPADYRVLPGKPYQIQFDIIGYNDLDNAALEIVYTAGYGPAFADIPETVRQSILIVAAYIHAHSGGCDSGQALNMSGAAELLRPYAVTGGIVF